MFITHKINKFNNVAADKQAIEAWSTKHGVSVRNVKRTSGGQFVSNLSAKQLTKVTSAW